MQPAIKAGLYHLSQIRHLALTKDAADTFFFMVTLRDNATPIENPQVDGQSEGVHCLYVNEHSAARLVFRSQFRNASAISMLEGFQFIREFEQLYLTNEECVLVPHIVFKSKESSKDDMDCYRHILERELSPAWAFCSLDDLNEPVNLTKLVVTFVTHQLNEIRSNKRVIATFNQGKGEVLINIQAGICRVFVTDGEGGVTCHATDVFAYVNGITPDYLKYIGGEPRNEHERRYNSLPWMRSLDGTKVRNATVSGALVRRQAGEHSLSVRVAHGPASMTAADLNLEMEVGGYSRFPKDERVLHIRRDKVRPESDFNGSYHIQRPTFFDPVAPVAKTDGPPPMPVPVPWSQVIRVFRMQLLAELQENHQMTCDQAIAYLGTHAMREDDDKLLRGVLEKVVVKPLPNLW